MAYGATLTLPTVSGSHTNFPTLLQEDDFVAAAIDGTANALANGGGDLVAYLSSAKTTQLPIEVVTFVSGGTPLAEVWVKLPTAATSNTIYIEKDSVQTVQPAATSTYGRDAVWADYEAVWHLNDLVDSTGNGATLSAFVGSPTSSTSGPIGSSYIINPSNNFISTPGGGVPTTLPITLQLIAEENSVSQDTDWLLSIADKDTGAELIGAGLSGKSTQHGGAYRVNNTTYTNFVAGAPVAGDAVSISARFTTTTNHDMRGYHSGDLITSANSDTLTINSWDSYGVGAAVDGSAEYGEAILDECRVRESILSNDWIDTEQDNLVTKPWVTSSAWADSGGSGGFTPKGVFNRPFTGPFGGFIS